MPNSDDCDQNYVRCKSKCFDVLLENLVEAAGDGSKIAAAKEKYKTCRQFCKEARAICAEIND